MVTVSPLYPCLPLLSVSSLWLLLRLCLKSPIRIVQSRFGVFLNVNLRQQLLLLSAFGFIMTRKIMQCLCCCCCSLLFFLLLLHTDCKTFILYLLGVLVLRLIIFLLLLLLLLINQQLCTNCFQNVLTRIRVCFNVTQSTTSTVGENL